MQLDADAEDEPFFKPNAVKTEPLVPKAQREREATAQAHAQGQQTPSGGGSLDGKGPTASEEGSTIAAEE